MSDIKVSTQVTPALHPENIKKLDGYDEDTAPYLGQVETAFSEAYEGIKAVWLATEKAKTNPTWNEAQQMIQTDDFAQKKLSRITRQFDSALSNLNKSIESMEQQLTTPLQQSGNSSLAAEIRAHVKTLPLAERTKFLEEAHRTDDHVTLCAVLAAPGYLSGISETERQIRTRLHHEATAPAVARRVQVMKAARTMMEERAGLVFGQMEKAVGAAPHKVKALREAKTQAEQAFIIQDNSSV